MTCRICQNDAGVQHTVREMMFDTREEFSYFECADCGCLQLVNLPDDLAKYYPADRYYSLQTNESGLPTLNPLRRWIKRHRDAAVLFDRPGPFRRLANQRPNPGIADVRRWLAPTLVRSYDARILDVGCGQGITLLRLADLGFTSLAGIEPYLPEDVHHKNVRILAQPLRALAGQRFDLVMFHHSFEHVANPQQVLREASELLSERGTCLIRIPIASRGPWRMYGTDWAEIDAPRHFFLHTELSMNLLAAQCGLKLTHVDYEAEPFSFAVSELYRRGIPLYSQEKGRLLYWTEAFTPDEIANFDSLASRYNVPGWAGRAAFFLSRHGDARVTAGFAEPDRATAER